MSIYPFSSSDQYCCIFSLGSLRVSNTKKNRKIIVMAHNEGCCGFCCRYILAVLCLILAVQAVYYIFVLTRYPAHNGIGILFIKPKEPVTSVHFAGFAIFLATPLIGLAGFFKRNETVIKTVSSTSIIWNYTAIQLSPN